MQSMRDGVVIAKRSILRSGATNYLSYLRLVIMGIAIVGLGMFFPMSAGYAETDVNLIRNPGFEVDEDKNGLPDGWHCRPGRTAPELAKVFLDTRQVHDGKYSLCIEHKGEEA